MRTVSKCIFLSCLLVARTASAQAPQPVAPTTTSAWTAAPTATSAASGPSMLVEEVKSSLPEWLSVVQVHGLVDVYYAFNVNRPADGANFPPGTGSTAKRFNEFNLNLAALDVIVDKAPVVGRLTLAFGNGIEVLHAGEPRAVATGPDVLRNVLTASVSFAPPMVPGLVLVMGKFPAHVGFEVMASKDNWNYTRAYLGEYSPYYLAGAKATYKFLKYFTLCGMIVNGWQNTGENNLWKSVGTMVAFNHEHVSLLWGTLVGPELPGTVNTMVPQLNSPDTRLRVFNDFVAVLKPSKHLNFAAQLDVGYQHPARDQHTFWHGLGGYVRMMPVEQLALALRAEYFLDPMNAVTGFAQNLVEATATVELRPAPFLSFKLEGRADYSTAPVFSGSAVDAAGTPVGANSQTMVAGGAVLFF
ncbi:MAG: outer membrane beta-barrel protein [Myxococcota bacterium]